jgi:hypothetical protein
MIGERYLEKLGTALESMNTEVIWIPDNPNVDPRLRGHVDLSLIHLGGNMLVGQGNHIVNILTNKGFEIVPAETAQRAEYPNDAGLNGCIVGPVFLHNTACTDKAVLLGLGERKIIHVNQGYTKCSVCVVDERSIITSDFGIAAAARQNGLDVLTIRQGYIELPGFEFGFIGGSAWKLSEHALAFTGRLDDHPDKDRILDYLTARVIEPVFLTDGPIFDIGSAIPIIEA